MSVLNVLENQFPANVANLIFSFLQHPTAEIITEEHNKFTCEQCSVKAKYPLICDDCKELICRQCDDYDKLQTEDRDLLICFTCLEENYDKYVKMTSEGHGCFHRGLFESM